MAASGSLRNLTTVMGSFHGRVLAARLGAEGIVVVLKGVSDGPYPLQGAVEVLVPAGELELAREILLADAVEDALADASISDVTALAGSSTSEVAAAGTSTSESAVPPAEPQGTRPRRARVRGAPAALVVVVVITLIIVAFVAAAR